MLLPKGRRPFHSRFTPALPARGQFNSQCADEMRIRKDSHHQATIFISHPRVTFPQAKPSAPERKDIAGPPGRSWTVLSKTRSFLLRLVSGVLCGSMASLVYSSRGTFASQAFLLFRWSHRRRVASPSPDSLAFLV